MEDPQVPEKFKYLTELLTAFWSIFGTTLLLVSTKYKKEIIEFFLQLIFKKNSGFVDSELNEESKLNAKIRQNMIELRAETNADRISLFTLKNGEQGINGYHFKKMKCLFEVLEDQIVSRKDEAQDLDITEFTEITNIISSSDPVDVLCINNLDQYSATKRFFISRGENCNLIHSIKINKAGYNLVWGFLLVSWCDSLCKGENIINLIKEIKEEKYQLCECIDNVTKIQKYVQRLMPSIYRLQDIINKTEEKNKK